MVDGEPRPAGLGVKLAGGDTIARAIEEARRSVDPRDRRAHRQPRCRRRGPHLARAIKARAEPGSRVDGRRCRVGGYYAASLARVPSPSTLTGSIGIFYGKLDVGGLFENRRHARGDRGGARADMESTTRPSPTTSGGR